jgi:hypothetical protein
VGRLSNWSLGSSVAGDLRNPADVGRYGLALDEEVQLSVADFGARVGDPTPPGRCMTLTGLVYSRGTRLALSSPSSVDSRRLLLEIGE